MKLRKIILQIACQGVPWTEEQASIIASKVRFLWVEYKTAFDSFDETTNPNSAVNSQFLYDPDHRLSTPDCDHPEHFRCYEWTTGETRRSDLSFRERKAIRLAFHDCVPYEDGSGGCDGCLNLDENRHDNLGLEFTAAILEKLYVDVNFPQMPAHSPNLVKSPKDLGMSRADLWAFVGLLALDEHLQFTKTECAYDNYSQMCGYNSSACYSPLPNYQKLFKTGRTDCIAKEGASELHQYLASKVEAHPHLAGNGEMTVKYFKDNFNMNGQAALALMGAHTSIYYGTSYHVSYGLCLDTD